MTTSGQIHAICLTAMIGVILSIIIIAKIDSMVTIKHDYQAVMVVDKSEKVEQAISNAVQSVTSRDFVLTGIEVTHPSMLCVERFVIKAKGCERATILRMDD